MPVEQLSLDEYVKREDDFAAGLLKKTRDSVVPRDITNYDWGKRALRPDPPYLANPDNSISTHRMAAERDNAGNWWAFPTIVENPYGDRGKLMEFTDHKEALQWNQDRGEAVPFGNDKAGALNFAEGGYKQGTPLNNRFPPLPPPQAATPGQFLAHPWASALNLASMGAGIVSQAFQPEPPGTDPMSLYPTDLLRQARQGILSDEDLAAIKTNPASPQSIAALAQASILISRGAGKGEKLNWRMVPGEEWASWKTVQHPMVGEGPAPEHSTDVVRPAVKQAPDGSFYEYQGSHVTQKPIDTESGRSWKDIHNIIAIPVEGPTGSAGWKQRLYENAPDPGSPEWFQKKSDDFQAKNFPDWVNDQLPGYGPNVIKGPQEGQKGPPPFKNPDAKMKEIEDLFKNKQPISAQDAETHYINGENYAHWLKDFGWTKQGDLYMPHEGPMLSPGEKVGPVDWNWYDPVGGKNPPYQPPGGGENFMDPHSPDFPGPNRWDYLPPTDRFNWEPPPDPTDLDFL